ncbi:MAG: hypothetical protein HRT47_05340 [Candidatus Caenarcaniphilales bacterium]|nr:hypothetical protein [Candidatus Caenarcaniphilales bacterium]
MIVSGVSEEGIGFTRSEIFDNNNYTQNNDDGSTYNIKHGLIRSGFYQEARETIEFTRYKILYNENYHQLDSTGIVNTVENGEIVDSSDSSDMSEFWVANGSLEDLTDFDLSNIDPNNEKFNQLMGSLSIKDLDGTIDYYGEKDVSGATDAEHQRKETIVKHTLALFGNDQKFLDAISEKGLNIVIVDEIKGENIHGEEFNGIGASCHTDGNLLLLTES